jgi:hypothetical protein
MLGKAWFVSHSSAYRYNGIELIRERMKLSPDNIISIAIFAILNKYLLFADNTRRRMQATVQYITGRMSYLMKIFKKQRRISQSS